MKQTIQLGVLSALGIGIGFLFQWFVLTQLGPGSETDALFAGMTLPQLVLVVISGSLMHVLVPLLAGETEAKIKHDAWCFLILVAGLFFVIAGVLYVTAGLWVPLAVAGFDEKTKHLTILLTQIQLIGMVFAAINGVQWATYHAKQQFIWAELTPIISSSIGLLLLIWALPLYGVIAAAWISTLRLVLQTLLMLPSLGFPPTIDLKNTVITSTWKRIKPLILGTAYYKTDPLVERFLLSNSNSGVLSIYYLAQQIYGAANQILNKAISSPLVPLLSQYHKSNDKEGFRKIYFNKLFQVILICLIGVLILVVFGKSILQILVGHGNVTERNVTILWWTMIYLSGMFIGGAGGQICASSFYSSGDTVTPTRMSAVTYTIYVPAKIITFSFLGVKGLALVTSSYYMINFLFQIYLLRKKRII